LTEGSTLSILAESAESQPDPVRRTAFEPYGQSPEIGEEGVVDIFLVRHGEMRYEENTELDLDLINSYATGERQGPLSDRGVRQARRVAHYLATKGVTALYSSTFLRARQTAEETSKLLGIPVETLEDLGELNVGRLVPEKSLRHALTFRGFVGLHALMPHLIGERSSKRLLGYLFIIFYFNTWYRGRTEGAESRRHALERIEGVFERLTAGLEPTARAAVFTHGYFIHLLVNHILDPRGAFLRMVKTPYIRNGSITHISRSEHTRRWKVEAYAQTIHLRNDPVAAAPDQRPIAQ